jgi:hypothetical protein
VIIDLKCITRLCVQMVLDVATEGGLKPEVAIVRSEAS